MLEFHITNSLDWPKVERQLERNIRVIQTTRSIVDEIRILRNIGAMVSELSIEEIECRRFQKQTQRHKEMVDKINEAIYNFEQITLIAYLTLGIKNEYS